MYFYGLPGILLHYVAMLQERYKHKIFVDSTEKLSTHLAQTMYICGTSNDTI